MPVTTGCCWPRVILRGACLEASCGGLGLCQCQRGSPPAVAANKSIRTEARDGELFEKSARKAAFAGSGLLMKGTVGCFGTYREGSGTRVCRDPVLRSLGLVHAVGHWEPKTEIPVGRFDTRTPGTGAWPPRNGCRFPLIPGATFGGLGRSRKTLSALRGRHCYSGALEKI